MPHRRRAVPAAPRTRPAWAAFGLQYDPRAPKPTTAAPGAELLTGQPSAAGRAASGRAPARELTASGLEVVRFRPVVALESPA